LPETLNSSAGVIHWPAAPVDLHFASNEVHVWAAPLSVTTADLAAFAGMLSTSERERAAKFKFDVHRNRFIAGRGWLRSILGRYLQTDPALLDFTYSKLGKPALSLSFESARLDFNLAHSEDVALLAVTQLGPVGVDVECIRPIKNVEDLVARFFSRRENEIFQKLPLDKRPAAFFNLWTRKEALLKATGEGIAGGLDRVEVSFLADEPARLLALPEGSGEATQWSLSELMPASGFCGAIAIRSKPIRVRNWK
jgi:4'-phosphopantetheinyl transferase